MGAGVAAAHLVVFITVASVGTVLVGAVTDAWRENSEAQAEAIQRIKASANEDIDLHSGGYHPAHCKDDDPPAGCQGTQMPERTYANFTNNGSEEIPLDEVTVLLDGTWTDTDTLDLFQIRGATTSQLWMPGEILEIQVDNQGNLDVSVLGPQGTGAHRRA